MRRTPLVALGIDPGSRRAGYGVVEESLGALRILDAGIIESRTPHEGEALLLLAQGLEEVFGRHQPRLVVLERLYLGRNAKTVIEVAQARGVVLALAERHATPCREFSPSEVKAMVAGDGRADKKTVAKAAALMCGSAKLDLIDDATDAIALAIAGIAAERHRERSGHPEMG